MGKRTISRRSFVGAGSLSAAALGMLLAGCGTTQQQSGSSNQTDAAKSDSLVAKTAYGPVKGTNEGGVNIWYGVPYGKSPEGELRWQAPEEPESWTEERDCTQPAQPALQYTNNEVTGTEDCLNLDVYATEGASKLPVLVYIHGGNNQTGNAQEIPGKDLVVNNSCVYVSLSYRLGLFGFNCLPALGNDTGNFTLLDIAATSRHSAETPRMSRYPASLLAAAMSWPCS